jgi:peptide/nickel transport system permease protein
MLGYVFRRVLQAVIVLIGVTLVAFVLQNLVASGPRLARVIIGGRAGTGAIQAFIHQYGLNKPLPVRYVDFVWQLLQGNLGYSYKLSESVDGLIGQTLPKDAILVGFALVIALLIAIPVGLLQASRRNRGIDYVGTGVAFILYSMPYFLLGLLLIALFAVKLKIFPTQAPQGTTVGQILSQPSGLVLPVMTLALGNYAIFSRYMRSSAVDTLTQDWVRTAHSKGLPERQVVRRHVLRNSLLSVVTLVGLSLPGVVTAGLIVEFVFNFPGTGVIFFNAATTSDYPVELGITVVVTIATVVGNLGADLAYAALDPRVRYV